MRKENNMGTKVETISINGIEYARTGCNVKKVDEYKGMKYQIVRTYSAGVFAGYVESRKGREIVIRDARRFWYWDGAASLSQLAMEGTQKPKECKFPCAVDRTELLQVIEIIDCTDAAKKSIDGVKIWEK